MTRCRGRCTFQCGSRRAWKSSNTALWNCTNISIWSKIFRSEPVRGRAYRSLGPSPQMRTDDGDRLQNRLDLLQNRKLRPVLKVWAFVSQLYATWKGGCVGTGLAGTDSLRKS